uniref:Uncharacterized protein n=1 Tax=Oryza punctata TaxID=4537 RepID=A0A0E0KU16_ORYPU
MARWPTCPFAQPKFSTSQPRWSKRKSSSQCVERRRGSGRARGRRGRWRRKMEGVQRCSILAAVFICCWLPVHGRQGSVVEMLVRGSQAFDSQQNSVQFKAVACSHFIEHILCMHGDCFDADGGNADFG